jgi:hypothetical protein
MSRIFMALDHQPYGQKCQNPKLKVRDRIQKSDAYILAVALKQNPFLSVMITWDKEHFKGKIEGIIYTPTEYPQNRP